MHAFLNHSPIPILVSWDHLYLTSLFVFPRYFNFELFQSNVILEILGMLKIWKDPKLNSIMYKKKCFEIGLLLGLLGLSLVHGLL